jgi:putative DNA primase/helicase
VNVLPLPDFLAAHLSQSSSPETTPGQPLPTIPEGSRHDYLLSMAGEMRRKGRSVEAIRAALLAESESRFVPPEDEDEIEKIVRSASEWPPGAAGPSGITMGASLTDEGNAKRLTNEYGHEIRYDAMREAWRRWDGKRWVLDDKHEVEWLARQVVQHIHFAADQEHDEKQKQTVRAWARRSEGGGRVEAMLKLARSTPDISLSAKELDGDPLLLNCANGVLDLRTGELLPHDPKRAISKLCPWPYDPLAPKPGRWQAFLDRILPGQEEQEWLQVLFGYCLTGLTSDQAFWVLWGAPGTGKSTTIDTMREVIGPDYAQVAQQTLLMEKKPGQATNDLATLHGARVVLHGDLPKGSLDIDLIKQLTGDGKVRARHLYMESFEFTPQCKLLISANTRPVMNENTAGIWRRLNLEIFGQQITETERVFDFYKLLVREEAPLILKWAVEGYWKYTERGRVPKPQSSITATRQYEADTDYLSQFLWDRCDQDNSLWCRFGDLLTSWTSWANENGIPARRYGRPWLKEELAHRSLEVTRRNGVEGVKGVELRAPAGRVIDVD